MISGTWSTAFPHARASSSTRCAFACRARSGEAHIWSSRRALVVLLPARICDSSTSCNSAPDGARCSRPNINPAVRLLELAQGFHLDRRVADDLQQLLVAPHVAFERGDVEVTDDQRGAVERVGPAGHPPEKIELLPRNFAFTSRSGTIARLPGHRTFSTRISLPSTSTPMCRASPLSCQSWRVTSRIGTPADGGDAPPRDSLSARSPPGGHSPVPPAPRPGTDGFRT